MFLTAPSNRSSNRGGNFEDLGGEGGGDEEQRPPLALPNDGPTLTAPR